METIAPLKLADHSWDNVGLLVESPITRSGASKVLLTIDLTPNVMDEVLKDKEIGVVVAYHPVIFRPLKNLSFQPNTKNYAVLQCVAEGVSVFCPHTALDACENGINDWLISAFKGDIEEVKPIVHTSNTNSEDCSTGMGRRANFASPVSLEFAVDKMKQHLKLSHLRLAKSKYSANTVKSVAVCAGSGSSILANVKADLIITGEMSHHEILAFVEKGSHVILCEHTNTERGYLQILANSLKDMFEQDGEGSVNIKVSQNDQDPIEIV